MLTMARESYLAQVSLLMRVLPYVADEAIFALKGGTAINLFYRDLPRLSVDIDLTYVPVKDRRTSLAEISAAMDRMAQTIERSIPGARTVRLKGGSGAFLRILTRLNGAEVKIETSPVMRGIVHGPERRAVTAAVANEFGYAEMQIVAFEDLFGGKLHAALDRQHPRDLFDIRLLYDNEGMTDDLFRTFLVYLASSPRPVHELLNPNSLDLDGPYRLGFEGMTRKAVSLDSLIATRRQLIDDIKSRLNDRVKSFLLSLQDGEPDFAAIRLPQAAELPAVRWKVLNVQKLIRDNPAKHRAQRSALEDVFD